MKSHMLQKRHIRWLYHLKFHTQQWLYHWGAMWIGWLRTQFVFCICLNFTKNTSLNLLSTDLRWGFVLLFAMLSNRVDLPNPAPPEMSTLILLTLSFLKKSSQDSKAVCITLSSVRSSQRNWRRSWVVCVPCCVSFKWKKNLSISTVLDGSKGCAGMVLVVSR